MKVAILGAGFTGLTTALRLIQKGLSVSVYEKDNNAGGLASGFKKEDWQWPLERSYHHLFTTDYSAINLLKELGIQNKLFLRRPITANLYQEKKTIKILQLDSAFSLLRFSKLSISARLRTGISLAYLRWFMPFWQPFEKDIAKDWIKHYMGRKSWSIIWEPLFISKFGKYTDKVNMAWFWARVKKRSSSLGYIQGGFQGFADRLVDVISKNNGNVFFGNKVNKVKIINHKWQIITNEAKSKFNDFDIVISTLPSPVFVKVFPQLPRDYIDKIQNIAHLHAQVLILELEHPFLPNTICGKKPYWVNICDSSFPFVFLGEHTNFIDSKFYNNAHIVYIGNYLPEKHLFLLKSKEELLQTFLPYLAKINPKILNTKYEIRNTYLFKDYYAQPVMEVDYSQKLPSFKTPLENLYLANLDQVYPWDRGVNYAVELGNKVTNKICQDIRF